MKLDRCSKCRFWPGGEKPAWCTTAGFYTEPSDLNKCYRPKPALVQTELTFD